MPGGRQRQSLVTTRYQDEGAVIAKDSQFMLNIADQDGDGLISMEEAREKGIDEATFKAIDRDGDGQLTENELMVGISKGQGISRSEVQRFKVANRSATDKELIENPGLCVGAWQWLVGCIGFDSISLLHDPLTEEMDKIKAEEAHQNRMKYDKAHADDPHTDPHDHAEEEHEEHEEHEHTVGWFELFYDLVFVAFVIELAAVLKEQTVSIGLPVVILAFLASWTTWFHVNMLMNRTETGGIYQILVYIIAFAMVIIAALSKLNRRVGPANIEAMFFMLVTRLCLVILYAALIYKYETKRKQLAATTKKAQPEPSMKVFIKYCCFLSLSIIICAIGIGIGGDDYEKEMYDGEVYQLTSSANITWKYPKIDANFKPLSKTLTTEGSTRLSLLWILVAIEVLMYYICDLVTDIHDRLTVDADHLIERNELWAILIIGESVISLVTTERPEVTTTSFLSAKNETELGNGDGGLAGSFYASLILSMTLVSSMIYLFMHSQPREHHSEFPFDVHAFNVPGSLSRGFFYNTANLICSLGFFGMGTGLKFVAYFSDKPCMYAFDHAILLTASCGMSIVAMNVARMTHQHGHGYESMGKYTRPIIVFLEIACGVAIAMIGYLFQRGVDDAPIKYKGTAGDYEGFNDGFDKYSYVSRRAASEAAAHEADGSGESEYAPKAYSKDYVKDDYSLYKFGNSFSDCFDKYGHKDDLTKGYGACYEKGMFDRFRVAADSTAGQAVHNCWKHYTHYGTTEDGESVSTVTIKQYSDHNVSPNELLGILVGCVACVILLEFILAPSSRVMALYQKDKIRRVNWNNAKKKMLRNLAKQYIPEKSSVEAGNLENDMSASPALRKWKKCVRIITEKRNEKAGQMWADVLNEFIGPKKKNRKIGDGDSVPFNYDDAITIPFDQLYVSMSKAELAETRDDLIEIEKVLLQQLEKECEKELQDEWNRRPNDAEVAERVRMRQPKPKETPPAKGEEGYLEVAGQHGGESSTDGGWEQEEMRQRIVQLTADVLRRDAHIVRLLQSSSSTSSSMTRGIWPVPQVTVEHL